MGKIQIMHNKRLVTVIFLALFCIVIQPPLYAGVYKWVDENGQVHYGEHPGNTDAEKVTIRQNETTKPRPIKQSEEDTDKQTEASGEWVEVPPSKKEKRKLCNEAKSDLAAINSRGRMREINEKGEYIYLTEPERQQRISAAMKKQQEFCR
jgi:hypothetical protein